ncbi:uncharacterized protein RCC_03566 [Ramularia collo-cygni]|uniref:Sucrose transporter SUT1D n=1 Tax=Ramularia collo-cygni TaxID=112498 RepID=A0A2D3V8B1_9PEZI|nr:uncharacterized protein RCC_03566 [Ramularia collo-cygni]CZT17729.1 uncharacterized protein RCC_03566 [Ramularia collo-cygni]
MDFPSQQSGRASTYAEDGRHDSETPLLGRDTTESSQDDKTKFSIGFLIALTCINGGLQVFFSTVMANLAPYLQGLGLSKSTTAAIIISIPLSGAIIGPSVGTLSDRLRSRWGRRRPIILTGAFLTIASLTLLAWTEQLVHLIAGCGDHDSRQCGAGVEKAVVALAVIFTILLAISVQPVQAGCRALTVDIAPSHEQTRASAYASRIQGAMAIFSFWASSLTFPEIPGLESLTQFQALSCLNFITLGSTVLLTCLVVGEEDSRRPSAEVTKRTILGFFREIWRNVRFLPERIRMACQVQFASWMAWFPLLFYTTTYIGELDKTAEQKTSNSGNQLAQAGSIGSLSFAIVGFIAVLTLPVITSRFFPTNNNKILIKLWTFTQPLLGLLLLLTLASTSPWQGIVLVALAGIPWAVTQWVPWALIGYETSRLGLTTGGGVTESSDESATTTKEDGDAQSGAILGIHNLAISLPQVLSGAVSIVSYGIAEKAGSEVPTAWVLASSGLAAFVAGYLARRML